MRCQKYGVSSEADNADIWNKQDAGDDTKLGVTWLYLVSVAPPCIQTVSVMSLCHAVLCGSGGKCVCVSPCHWRKESMLV